MSLLSRGCPGLIILHCVARACSPREDIHELKAKQPAEKKNERDNNGVRHRGKSRCSSRVGSSKKFTFDGSEVPTEQSSRRHGDGEACEAKLPPRVADEKRASREANVSATAEWGRVVESALDKAGSRRVQARARGRERMIRLLSSDVNISSRKQNFSRVLTHSHTFNGRIFVCSMIRCLGSRSLLSVTMMGSGAHLCDVDFSCQRVV